MPDPVERDLVSYLETALRSALLAERWPKSGLDVVITILDGEEEAAYVSNLAARDWGFMNVLSGCINVASAAIADAGVDCIDLIAANAAVSIVQRDATRPSFLLDPCPSDGDVIQDLCVVAYSQARDEVTLVWTRTETPLINGRSHNTVQTEDLLNNAIEAASAVRLVIVDAVKEGIRNRTLSNRT